MAFAELTTIGPIALITLCRGKVNALNPEVVAELRARLQSAEADPSVEAVIVTGSGRFFSFGFDIPEFLSYRRDDFTRYLCDFTALYTELFLYSKPVVAALNGHAIAGGCMLALACDTRVMSADGGRIGLNEIGFGSTVFAGSAEMLRFTVGSARAAEVLYSGTMYPASTAREIGLVDEVVDGTRLMARAGEIATTLAGRRLRAFSSTKLLLRKPIADEMARRERASIDEFVDIWYSEPTWSNLQNITIRS